MGSEWVPCGKAANKLHLYRVEALGQSTRTVFSVDFFIRLLGILSTMRPFVREVDHEMEERVWVRLAFLYRILGRV